MKKNINCEDFFYDGSHYISKNSYYHGANFLIYPTWEEVNRNILILGDRWHPFCSSQLAPWEMIVTDSYEIFPHKRITLPLETLLDYHPLLGTEILINNMLTMFSNGNTSFRIPVLDLKNFFSRNHFKIGDALRIKVINYEKGIYLMESIGEEEKFCMEETSENWILNMEKAMERVILSFGNRLILPNQIDWAYFMGGHNLMKNPTLNVHHFLKKTKRFKLSTRNGVNFLEKK